jgi:hypothetical protein
MCDGIHEGRDREVRDQESVISRSVIRRDRCLEEEVRLSDDGVM